MSEGILPSETTIIDKHEEERRVQVEEVHELAGLEIILPEWPHGRWDNERVAVIVVNYFCHEATAEAVLGIIKNTPPPLEIIVVDNSAQESQGGRDFLRKEAQKYAGIIKYVESDINRGFAGGVNLGMKFVSPESRFILLLNPDSIPLTSDWKEKALKVLKENFFLCGLDLAGGPWFLDESFFFVLSSKETEKRPVPSVICSGAAFLWDRSRGGDPHFDEKAFFPAYMEDADLCLRTLRERGLGFGAYHLFQHRGHVSSSGSIARGFMEHHYRVILSRYREMIPARKGVFLSSSSPRAEWEFLSHWSRWIRPLHSVVILTVGRFSLKRAICSVEEEVERVLHSSDILGWLPPGRLVEKILVVEVASTPHHLISWAEERGWRILFSNQRSIAHARTVGITQARGILLSFLDDDEAMCPGRLVFSSLPFQDANVGMIYCDATIERGEVNRLTEEFKPSSSSFAHTWCRTLSSSPSSSDEGLSS